MTSKKQKLPVCPDKYYHIYNRGNNKEQLFYHHGDYSFFLEKYVKYVYPYADTFAYCLLPNHFHFLIRTRNEVPHSKSVVPNQLRKLFICYSMRINYYRKRSGSLFTKNYQRIEITNNLYLKTLVRYIHHNPIKHGVQANLDNYPFSSYKEFFNGNPGFLSKAEALSWFDDLNEFISFHHSNDHESDIIITDNLDDKED